MCSLWSLFYVAFCLCVFAVSGSTADAFLWAALSWSSVSSTVFDPCVHPRGAQSPHCKDARGVRSQGWLLSPELLLPSRVTGRLLKPSEPQFRPLENRGVCAEGLN